MVKATVEDQPDLTLPEDTLLRAVLKEVKEKKIEWKDRQTQEEREATLLEWWFEVNDEREGGKFKGRKVRKETDNKITNHPRNGFRLIAEALLGRELAVGAGVDTDEDLVGLTGLIMVEHRPFKDKNGNDRIAEDIVEVVPPAGMEDVPF